MKRYQLKPAIDRIQLAGLDVSLWPDVLDDISRAADGAGAVLFSTDRRTTINPRTIVPPSSRGLLQTSEDYVADGWHKRDERFKAVPALLKNGIATDMDFTTEASMARSPFYQDFLRRNDLGPFAVIGFKTSNDLWALSIKRHKGQSEFEHHQLRQLLSLRRPLSDAAVLSRQLGFARVAGMADAFDYIRQPAAILDDLGHIVALNGLAEELENKVFFTRNRRLVLVDQAAQAHFDRSIWHNPASLTPTFTVLRNTAGQQVATRTIVLTDRTRFCFTNAKFLILFGQSAERGKTEAAILGAAFGLTPAEVRLTTSLMTGRSLRATAEKMEITYETARTHLRSVFSKTATHRQAELIALISETLR